MIRQQVPFFNLALLLLCKAAKDLPKVLPKFTI
jgi:hypothetical protein